METNIKASELGKRSEKSIKENNIQRLNHVTLKTVCAIRYQVIVIL